MVNCSSLLHFTQFADDTTLAYSCKDFRNLQTILEQEVHKVSKWLAANKLILNVTKTHSMLFTFKPNVPNLNIKINNVKIEEKCTTSF